MIIKSFLRSYKSQHRPKRQIGLVAFGLASALGYGANRLQINHINGIIRELKQDSLHKDNRIDIIKSAVEFNSKTLIKLDRMQNEVMGIMESSLKGLKGSFNEISNQLRELSINMAYISSSMGYFKLEKLIHNLMQELKSLFNGKFESEILNPEIKNNI